MSGSRKRTSRSSGRLLEIASAGLRHVLPGCARSLRERSWRQAAVGLRRAFEQLGPAFIKLGQFLSVRADLLPSAVVEELERLQDSAPPLPQAAVQGVIERELRAPVEVLFADFDWRPVATASVSQVHRAVLPSGRAVAVKVQRPGVEAEILRDVRLAGALAARALSFTPLRKRIDAAALQAEIAVSCERELDFRNEAEAAETLAREFSGWPRIRIPAIHWGWTSRRVLTADFVEGVKISAAQVRVRSDYAALAELGARAFLRQILEGEIFHADLHPANLLITPAGEIAYLDFGIVGRLSAGEREGVLGALAGMLARDAPLALRSLARLGVRVPRNRAEGFTRDIGRVIDESAGRRLADVSMTRIGREILSAVRRHGVVFPHKYAMLVKALLTIEGSARSLHPDFSFETAALDYLKEAGRRSVRISQLAEAAWRGAALLGVGALAAAEG